jgi:Zn-dependent protease
MTEGRKSTIVLCTLIGWVIAAFPVVLWLTRTAMPTVVLVAAITGLTTLGTFIVLGVAHRLNL